MLSPRKTFGRLLWCVSGDLIGDHFPLSLGLLGLWFLGFDDLYRGTLGLRIRGATHTRGPRVTREGRSGCSDGGFSGLSFVVG